MSACDCVSVRACMHVCICHFYCILLQEYNSGPVPCVSVLHLFFYIVFSLNTIPYNTIQYNTIQYNTIQYNTIQYNTIQYNVILAERGRIVQVSWSCALHMITMIFLKLKHTHTYSLYFPSHFPSFIALHLEHF